MAVAATYVLSVLLYGGSMAKSPRINFVVPYELRKRLERVCAETGMPLSLVIRKALDGYLSFCEEKFEQEGSSFNVNSDKRGRYWK